MIATIISILAILIILPILSCMLIYNKLVIRRNLFKDAYSQIDVELKRRYDLIPNLLECLRGYMKNESETLETVIRARNLASAANTRAAGNPGDPGPMKGLMEAEGVLRTALTHLFSVVENSLEIKADETVRKFMEEIKSTENKIAHARQAYNDAVLFYNSSREKFPNLLVANPFGFKEAFLLDLELTAAHRDAPLLAS
ncbi:MAG: LemA family protein [Desulfobacteraceae bacterium]|jgi:LemA protein